MAMAMAMAMRKGEGAVILRATVVLMCSAWAGAVWMHVPATGSKCVSEEIRANVVVLADYTAAYEDDEYGTTASVSSKVTSPYGNILHQEENVTKGQFAFTTSESGSYLACFTLDSVKRDAAASVNVNWRIGVAAKDWDSVTKKEKIEGVELEMRKLEGAVEAIHDNFLYLMNREAEMRAVSERTNSRIASFSVMSLGICIIVSVLQLWHLTGFFQKKKII